MTKLEADVHIACAVARLRLEASIDAAAAAAHRDVRLMAEHARRSIGQRVRRAIEQIGRQA